MLLMVLVVVIAVVPLISVDRVGGQHTTDGRRRKAVDERILSGFLRRRPQRRPPPRP
jgi:hypothetical protein